MPPMEDDTNPEPGSMRVRPSSADKSSTQVRLLARASACGTPWPGPACALACSADTSLPGPMVRACRSWQGKCVLQRLLRESQHPPLLPQLRLSTTILSGGGSTVSHNNSLHSNGRFQKFWKRLSPEH
eukprot:scaffold3234_cov105-Isochrysis_galbana.AAC.3